MDTPVEAKTPQKRGRKPSLVPLSERKIEYDRTQQERNIAVRQKAKEIRKNEDVTKQHLYFLTHIIKSQGLSWGEVSTLCGLSQQALSWILIKDDTKLQNAKMILRSLGMELLPEFAQTEDAKTKVAIKGDNYELVGEIPSIKHFIALDAIVNTSLTNNDDMAFLAKFLTENRITLAQLSEKTQISVASYKNSFTKQNIQISTLYHIAEVYETKIIWRVKALDNTK